MKLLCDQMLGTLALWLRVLGYDTYFTNKEITDDELLQIALDEQRTLISRDKRLIQRARKQNIALIELSTTDLDEQLHLILPHLEIKEDKLFSRCTLCNTRLILIEKKKIRNMVPERVFEQQDTFWFCDQCKKPYWKGTHYENMVKKIEYITGKKLSL
ncbi:MAG: Mut7-C RNAse domain-containing protein [Methanobacteriota archaeon]